MCNHVLNNKIKKSRNLKLYIKTQITNVVLSIFASNLENLLCTIFFSYFIANIYFFKFIVINLMIFKITIHQNTNYSDIQFH